ncbi:MAG: DUF1492 domain-containing protein, partial [Clostridia bacterium]|nr:DUF1492 domain-containing protein [Clostridia bacterium]
KEIKEQQRRLSELEALATSCTAKITGLPNGNGVSDKIANYATEIADLENLIAENLKQCIKEYKKLTIFIKSIEDSQLRLILTLRYINNFTWQQIAQNMGVLGDGSTERKKHNRFLKLSRNSRL